MVDFTRLTAKARQFARRNPGKVEQALNRAGDFVDQRTGRKYERHVDTVQQKARQFLGGDRTTGGPAAEDRPAERPGEPGSAERPGEPGSAGGPGEPGSAERPGGDPGSGRPDQGSRP